MLIRGLCSVNLTSSSIWLDDDYCAKLADAGTPLLLPPSASPGLPAGRVVMAIACHSSMVRQGADE